MAVFSQGWTWEKTTDMFKDYWTQGRWWEYERKLWVGTTRVEDPTFYPTEPKYFPLLSGQENGPTAVPKPLEPKVAEKLRPFSSYFPTHAPPNPAIGKPFVTNFSTGTGYSWFVRGDKVINLRDGWCDIDKQTWLGDDVWVKAGSEGYPKVDISFDDAWIGGSSLVLSNHYPAWNFVSISSLAISPLTAYSVGIVWKFSYNPVGVSVQPVIQIAGFPVTVSDEVTKDVESGWFRSTLRFTTPSQDQPAAKLASIGLKTSIASRTRVDAPLSLLIGQIVVAPVVTETTVPDISDIQFVPITGSGGGSNNFTGTSLNGTLRWKVDDSFLFYNVYASATAEIPSYPLFVGTTGVDGNGPEFIFRDILVRDVIPNSQSDTIWFFVQGVTDKGEVTKYY
jgi:mannosyl-glycoprotein endo-beta-N-acetylglucosaminidase